MATRSQKVKLGVFLTVTAVLFAGTIVVFAGMTLFDVKEVYYIYFRESISGLEAGSPVKLRGVNVGTVRSIGVNPKNVQEVKVTVALDEETPVKTDTRAILSYQGITGLKFVELKGGTEGTEHLEPGGRIPPGESLVDKIGARADTLTDKIDRVIDNLLIITGPDNQRALASALARLDGTLKNIDELTVQLQQVTEEMRKIIEENRDPIRRTLRNVSGATGRVEETVSNANALISQLRGKLDGVDLAGTIEGIQQTNQMVQQQFASIDVESTIDDVTVTLSAMQLLLQQMTQMMGQNQDQLRATMYNLRLATESLKEFSRAVQHKPSLLLFDESPKERELP